MVHSNATLLIDIQSTQNIAADALSLQFLFLFVFSSRAAAPMSLPRSFLRNNNFIIQNFRPAISFTVSIH